METKAIELNFDEAFLLECCINFCVSHGMSLDGSGYTEQDMLNIGSKINILAIELNFDETFLLECCTTLAESLPSSSL